VAEAVQGSDVVAHFATSIPTGNAATKASAWELNDRLRGLGTSNLVLAAEQTGARRFIFESISLAYPDRGDEWIEESCVLEPVAPMMRSAVDAEAMVARFGERGGEAVSLRIGRLYGPGRASDSMIEAVRARQMPIVGRGSNFVSSAHVDDVGTAVVAALDAAPGVYNVVDDEPLTQRDWMEAMVEAVEGPAPRRVPFPLARIFAGKAARVIAVSQRVSNGRLRAASDWEPRYRSAREGLQTLATSASGGMMAAS
jgi:nucleoside-diphosphate-sugar epimerase